MVEHKLKTWPVYYDAVERGEKPFEVRRDDRGFQKGDVLVLQRTSKDGLSEVEFVGVSPDRPWDYKVKHELRRRITYVLTGGRFGIEAGYVVLGLAEVD